MDPGIARACELAVEMARREIGRLRAMADGGLLEHGELSDVADRLEHAVGILKRVAEVRYHADEK